MIFQVFIHTTHVHHPDNDIFHVYWYPLYSSKLFMMKYSQVIVSVLIHVTGLLNDNTMSRESWFVHISHNHHVNQIIVGIKLSIQYHIIDISILLSPSEICN